MLGCNMFAYCGNNPLAHSDHRGYSKANALSNFSDKYCSYALQEDIGGGGGGNLLAVYALSLYTSITAIIQVTENPDGLIDSFLEKLSKSLAKTGRQEYKTEFEEHHIVAKKAVNAKKTAHILNSILPNGVEDPLNKVMLKTSVHRRVHSGLYYLIVNQIVISAYDQANGDYAKQYQNVVSVLAALSEFLQCLNLLATN